MKTNNLNGSFPGNPRMQWKVKNNNHHNHHSLLPSDPELRVKTIESLLLSKGLIDPDSIEEIIDLYENKIGPQNGAKVIAKAWTDNEYKKRLIINATSAIAELGFTGRQGENIIVVENTEKIQYNSVYFM